MRPIKLSMAAFGPYKDKEIIDFRGLDQRNLFLITGPTGAGKTTLFDAISFAIYGEASGTTRPSDSMRSHFSDNDLMTEVELLFELKGVQYHIHRIPKQDKPKIKGVGFTEQKPEATLKIFRGDEPQVVAGVKNVNDKIESILGINAEQFKQIMMIPQGEFQKLLTASTEEREQVLQKLFDTSLYNSVQNLLSVQAKSLEGEISNSTKLRNHDIERIDAPDLPNLMAMIQAEDKHVEEIVRLSHEQIRLDQGASVALENRRSELQKEIAVFTQKREETKGINYELKQKEALRLKISGMEKENGAIEALKVRVQSAEEALRMEPIEGNYLTRQREAQQKQEELSVVKAGMLQETEKASHTEVVYKKEISAENQQRREGFIAEIARLKAFKDKVSHIDHLIRCIQKSESTIATTLKNKDQKEESIKATNQALEVLRHKSTAAKEAELKASEEKRKLAIVLEEGKKLQKLSGLSKDHNKSKEELTAETKAVAELNNKVKEEEGIYKNLKLQFLVNQAASLAKELGAGQPCPVCGSSHHPQLAKFRGDPVSEEDLLKHEEALKIRENAYNQRHRMLGKLETTCLQLKDSLQDLYVDLSGPTVLGESEPSDENFEEVVGQWIEKNRIDLLTHQSQVKDLEEAASQYQQMIDEIEGLGKTLKLTEEQLQKELTVYHQISNELALNQAKLQDILEEVPESIRSGLELANAIAQQEIMQKQVQESFDHALKDYEVSRNKLLALHTNENQLEKDIHIARERLEADKLTFEETLSASGFASREAYRAALLEKDAIQKYKNEIEAFVKDLHSLKEQRNIINLKTQGQEPVDIKVFEEHLESCQNQMEICNDQKSILINRIKSNSSILEAVKAVGLQIGDKETRYRLIGNLSKIAKGSNKLGITFERYVLAAFLKDILVAANTRLSQMTGGRYKLSVTDERQRSNAKGGLDLEVFDNYTGKSRHVKTLSGGEGFKASLSMALGLADMVQSYAGGVQLDTMFIDEGFGTLDQESLDSAINCLIELQKTGRLVGIISHVQELKERIDTRLEVISSQNGSTTRFVLS